MAKWECRRGEQAGTMEVQYHRSWLADEVVEVPMVVASIKGLELLAWVLSTPTAAPGDVVVIDGDREYLLQPFGAKA